MKSDIAKRSSSERAIVGPKALMHDATMSDINQKLANNIEKAGQLSVKGDQLQKTSQGYAGAMKEYARKISKG